LESGVIHYFPDRREIRSILESFGEILELKELTCEEPEIAAYFERGGDPNPYWAGIPQLNTVGYLTGVAGSMAAGFAMGWLTGRFDPPFSRVQFNIVSRYFDVQEIEDAPRAECGCRKAKGWGDQGVADALISAPSHWPVPVKLGMTPTTSSNVIR
jgi:hypothetical protein